jgi:hypothetical protein
MHIHGTLFALMDVLGGCSDLDIAVGNQPSALRNTGKRRQALLPHNNFGPSRIALQLEQEIGNAV